MSTCPVQATLQHESETAPTLYIEVAEDWIPAMIYIHIQQVISISQQNS